MDSPLLTIAEIAAAPKVSMLGAELPGRFSDLSTECEAVRCRAGVFDASFRRWTRALGEDRTTFIQGMVSNDVARLAAGRGTYAAMLTQQGKIVTDLRVYAGADHLLLDFPSALGAAALQSLERFIVADDIELEPLEAPLIGLEGPRAPAILGELGLSAIGAAEPGLEVADATLAGCTVRLATASHAGEVGVLIGCAGADTRAVWEALRANGAEPVGAEALNALRVEAGIPWMGVDMSSDTLIVEANLDRAISFSKGCYLGQEVVERVASRGHANRKRVGLTVEGDPLPSGTPLFSDTREIGWVTSMVRLPRRGAAIGMGYVRRELLDPGTELVANAGETRVVVRVAALPFYSSAATALWPDV